jgi:hypothetical protein
MAVAAVVSTEPERTPTVGGVHQTPGPRASSLTPGRTTLPSPATTPNPTPARAERTLTVGGVRRTRGSLGRRPTHVQAACTVALRPLRSRQIREAVPTRQTPEDSKVTSPLGGEAAAVVEEEEEVVVVVVMVERVGGNSSHHLAPMVLNKDTVEVEVVVTSLSREVHLAEVVIRLRSLTHASKGEVRHRCRGVGVMESPPR